MIRGNVELEFTFGNGEVKSLDLGSNMIMDNVGHQIVRMLTTPPDISSISDMSGVLDTSNYTIQAISFSKPATSYSKHAHVNTSSGDTIEVFFSSNSYNSSSQTGLPSYPHPSDQRLERDDTSVSGSADVGHNLNGIIVGDLYAGCYPAGSGTQAIVNTGSGGGLDAPAYVAPEPQELGNPRAHTLSPSGIVVGGGFMKVPLDTFTSDFALPSMADSHEGDPISAIIYHYEDEEGTTLTRIRTAKDHVAEVYLGQHWDQASGCFRSCFYDVVTLSSFVDGLVSVSGTAVTTSGVQRDFPLPFTFFNNLSGGSPAPAGDINYWVSAGAPSGGTGTSGSPFTSLEDLTDTVDSASDLGGATVWFTSGAYTFGGDRFGSTTASRWVTLRPAPGLTTDDVVFNAKGTQMSRYPYIHLSGITVSSNTTLDMRMGNLDFMQRLTKVKTTSLSYHDVRPYDRANRGVDKHAFAEGCLATKTLIGFDVDYFKFIVGCVCDDVGDSAFGISNDYDCTYACVEANNMYRRDSNTGFVGSALDADIISVVGVVGSTSGHNVLFYGIRVPEALGSFFNASQPVKSVSIIDGFYSHIDNPIDNSETSLAFDGHENLLFKNVTHLNADIDLDSGSEYVGVQFINCVLGNLNDDAAVASSTNQLGLSGIELSSTVYIPNANVLSGAGFNFEYGIPAFESSAASSDGGSYIVTGGVGYQNGSQLYFLYPDAYVGGDRTIPNKGAMYGAAKGDWSTSAVVDVIFSDSPENFPAAEQGLTSSGTYFSRLNQIEQIDSSGFINMTVSSVIEGSQIGGSPNMGLIMTSGVKDNNPRTIEYRVDLSGGDFLFSNLFGGIYSMGLWGLDMETLQNSGITYPISFNNLNNPRKYKLFAKKSFLKDLTFGIESGVRSLMSEFDSNGEVKSMKIIWGLRFV